MGAYTLSDRGTWLSFGNKRDLIVLVEGDTRLLNRYDVILLDPVNHPQAKQEPAPNPRRLARLAARPSGDRRLRNQWRAAVPPLGGRAEMMES